MDQLELAVAIHDVDILVREPSHDGAFVLHVNASAQGLYVILDTGRASFMFSVAMFHHLANTLSHANNRLETGLQVIRRLSTYPT